ncbi:GntR family transcriptional regulator [Microbacterium sp. PRC9]|uniref:GntR family transcriptional regulator n=1 Tax=Microbacterium sp. PRC9 TaxID=2962591 RepID=UPI0028829B73|nr:GntR family transcriptional regulator [Microbacterium sp. PRC9]MDT0143835.1 GntR family transcriptional regulator [Microbacterium sp. PRC9]
MPEQSEMSFVIDPSSAVPPFEQLRTGLVDAVASGELAAGARLPTVRRLAEDLGVAPGTVARAYRELEASGIIETRGRNGTFVAFDADPARQQLQRAAAAFAAQVRDLHLDAEEALAVVTAALRSPGATTA